jgi:histidyl-tRNA synthetase
MFGIKQPTADAEVILMAVNYLKSIGLDDLDVEINSLGCPKCREEFKNKLKAVLKPYFDELCEDCKNRYEKNPLRLLDCKVDSCKAIFEKPEVQEVINSDFICEECSEHYTELKLYLDKMGVKYTENKLLVRGLDYYNRTVFEIKSNNLGSQNAVAGGGRYDSLVGQLGGEPTPAIGFAMGMERLISLLEQKEPKKLDGYVVSNFPVDAFVLAEELRAQGLSVEIDLSNKKFTKQLEKAAKVAKYAFILGEEEVLSRRVSIKNLEKGTQITVDRTDCVKMLEV